MRRSQWIAFGALVAFGLLVAVLFFRNRQAPPLPTDTDHTWLGAENCLVCHGPDGALPRDLNHPIGLDCMKCHGMVR